MGHLSIAIIKRQSTSPNFENKSDFLVCSSSNVFSFFEVKNNAIGGGFDYSEFKKRLFDYFGFRRVSNDGEIIDFKEVKPFKNSKRDPYATAYEYILSEKQIKFINQKKEEDSSFLDNYEWLTEGQIIKKQKYWKKSQKFIFSKEIPFQVPKFTNSLRASLNCIIKAKDSGKLVVFAGAGVSIDSNVPSWNNLIKELKFDLDTKEQDPLEVAQLYYTSRGKKEYYEKITQVLQFGVTQSNPIHHKILELNPHHILTTNYDNHFEQAIYKKTHKYSLVKKDTDLPYTKGTSLLIKMHGDIEERNIVLKKSDYTEYSKNFPLIEGFVKGIFASKLVLFIGFSFSDPNLEFIVDSVKSILKEDNQSPYILVTIDKEEINKKNYKKQKSDLIERGVRIVEYDEDPFNDYFTQVASDEDEERLKKLSLIGQKAYKFLKVIEVFDPFSDTLENLDIKDQLINSLFRFKEFGALPAKVLEDITPFKLKRKSISELSSSADYNPFTLETLNEELLSFLSSISDKENQIVIKSISNHNSINNQHSLNQALHLLYASAVGVIRRKNDTSPIDFTFSSGEEEINCNCSRCLITKFQYQQLLRDLYTDSIEMISSHPLKNVSLNEINGLQRTGQFIKAFHALEELKSTAWRNQEYITLFIASQNQVLLKKFLWGLEERSVNAQELDKVKKKISKIDLDKIIQELPISQEVRRSLVILKDDEVYANTRSVIEGERKSIIEIYKSYKKDLFSTSGPYYWYNLETAMYVLNNFYFRNFLFNDECQAYFDIVDNYLEAMIASYSTSDKYEQRLPNYSPFFRQMLLQYGEPQKLIEHIKTYGVDKFVFKEQKKEVEKTIELFTSLSESSYTTSTLFGKEIYPDKLFNYTIGNSHFFQFKIRRVYNVFLIFLSRIELTNSQVNKIVELSINHFKTNTIFESYKALKYFIQFLELNIKKLTDKNIISLLYFSISKELWSDNLIEPICDAIINQKKNEQILDDKFYKLLIDRIENNKQWRINYKDAIPFYPLLRTEQQDKFLIALNPIMDDIEVIRYSYYWGVWSIKNDSEIFDKYILKLIELSKNYPNIEINDEGCPKKIFSFSEWNQLNFIVSRIYEFNLFEQEFVYALYDTIDSEMYKWILRPHSFDYSIFNQNWILVFGQDRILEKLSQIKKCRIAIEKGLKVKFNPRVAEIYHQKM